jgi:Core-2/I-Branching enzyme
MNSGEFSMVRLAYLVQCHKNFSQVNRMIRALNFNHSSAISDFYIHVDKKSDISSKIIRADNIFLVDDSKRIDVKWGKISQVDATLILLRMIIESKREYDYVWLISGQDYPIKSEDDIVKFFQKKSGENFINVLDNRSRIYKRFLKRNTVWYPRWIDSSNILIKILRRIYIFITGGTYYTFPFLKKKCPFNNITYYFGANWFTISYQTVKYILEFLEKNKNYYNFFKNTEIPDESFFHTIIFNSPFSKKYAEYLCYVDWGDHKRNPKILTTVDYKNLIRSDLLIARKFDLCVDSKVLDMLDEHRKE